MGAAALWGRGGRMGDPSGTMHIAMHGAGHAPLRVCSKDIKSRSESAGRAVPQPFDSSMS